MKIQSDRRSWGQWHHRNPHWKKPLAAGGQWSGWVAGSDATTDSDDQYECDLIPADAQTEATH
ncbi:MAG: hypothetical protein VXZ82_24855 [Planctomycetota bacterium]|nr:hypothetical protein [Planctomycetota bacterium]